MLRPANPKVYRPQRPQLSHIATAPASSPVVPTSSGNGAAEYLTVDEAAAVLKVKPSTVRQWVREGRLPCYRLGLRATRFTRELLDRFAEGRLDPGPSWRP